MNNINFRNFILLALIFCLFCSDTKKQNTKNAINSPQLPSTIIFNPLSDKAVYTYRLDNGKIVHKEKPSNISKSNDIVIVTPLSLNSKQRGSTKFLWVIEQAKLLEKKILHLRRISRIEIEKSHESIINTNLIKKDLEDDDIIVFSTSWCGACDSAKEFLKSNNLAFKEVDIEKDPKAKERLFGILKLNSMEFQGVPVISIKGKAMTGFDKDWVFRNLKKE